MRGPRVFSSERRTPGSVKAVVRVVWRNCGGESGGVTMRKSSRSWMNEVRKSVVVSKDSTEGF